MCIFAKQLHAVLQRHGREIGSLYAIYMGDRKIGPQQILRLKQAVGGDCSISVALNPDELDAVIQAFKLDAEDVRRLRAALTAESFYRFFIDRVGGKQTLKLAEQLFDAMLSNDTRDFTLWKDFTFEDVRDISGTHTLPDELPAAPVDRDMRIKHDLEPAIELYEEAQLWLATARSATGSIRRVAYTQLAVTILDEAQDLLRYPTGILEDTPELADWQEIISTARVAAHTSLNASS